MNIAKGCGLVITMVGFMILFYSISFDGERFFEYPSGGIFLGVMTAIIGIIVYVNSKKRNGMIHVR